MNQTAVLRRRQGARHLQANLECKRRCERPAAAQTRFERFAFDKLHRVKAIAGIGILLRA